jgi:HCOMODA/2-hydroxy-3-carboxy-muconic semialdehyde decarboxylase
MAVVHTHSPAVIPFSVVRQAPLRAVSHMGPSSARRRPCSRSATAAGDASDMLIRDNALGRALAASLGRGTAVLMRGHGITVVGSHAARSGVPRGLFRVQRPHPGRSAEARPVTYMTGGEAAASAAQQRVADRPRLERLEGAGGG